jgi:hypothetical protein
MLLLSCIGLLSCLAVHAAAVSSDFTQGLANSGWEEAGGDVTTAATGRTGAGVALGLGAGITREVMLAPGVYELTAWAKGTGALALDVKGAAHPASRTLALRETFGLYGLLFAVEGEKEAACRLTLAVRGKEAVLDDVAVTPATPEQRAAWDAAQRSYSLLGYFGIDPQRPAPGEKAATGVLPTFSAANLQRWTIREAVVFHDPGYDACWVDDDAQVAAYFTRRGMPAKNAVETEAWLKARADGDKGVGSAIIFTMGVAPATSVSPPYADCLLARYLRAGGRVVWLANAPMYVAQAAKGPFVYYGTTPAEEMLGLSTDRKTFYGINGPVVMTAAGKAWGLEPGLTLTRPVHSQGVSLPFFTDESGDYCGVGMVTLRSDLPLSGFIFVPDWGKASNEILMANLYRLAQYSGKPVTVPAAAPLPAPAVPLEASLRFGTDDRRMIYLRGETVPLVLRLRALSPAVQTVPVHATLRDGTTVLMQQDVSVPVTAQETYQEAGFLNLDGLRVGRYTVSVELTVDGKTLRLERELRLAPPPDHGGTYLGVWVEASPKVNRTEDLLNDLAARHLDPMFTDSQTVGMDLALWYGMSATTRRHGESANAPNPPGYDNYRRGSNGDIMRVSAWGDKRVSQGYASPFRRQAEADDFGRQVLVDNIFPAFRRRTVTSDDYSQWFGLNYNRFAVEGFRAKYGIDPPKPTGTEDPLGTVNVAHAPGIIADDDSWILLNRYWSETLGDSGRRFSRAMEAATGGMGKVGPVPGGMQLPVVSMWSGQYPPFNFGPNGYSMSCFYYYNSFWQPPMAFIWWLECSRMGNRGIEQWMMPDCYQMHLESFYRNNLWLMLAGGAQGLPYFCYDARKPEAISAMSAFGARVQRYGLLLGALRPVQKKVALLVPFENVTYRIENGYEMAYPFMNLLLAKIDAEPVSPEELDAASIRRYEAVVLAHTQFLKAGTVKLLEEYIAGGGTVVVDSETPIPITGAKTLDFPLALGGAWIAHYGHTDRIARVRAALLPYSAPVVDCADPFVAVRRAALPDGTPGVWLVHNYTQDEYAALRAGKDGESAACRALEDKLGYRKDIITTTITRADDGRIPVDVFSGRVLDATRADGNMTVTLDIAKWEGRLLLFLPALPGRLRLSGLPATVKPGLPMRLVVDVRDKAGAAITTPLPLQLTVRDPQGNVSREYSRRLLTEGGSARQAFAFAVNDVPGTWTLEVEDVLTGVKAQGTVVLAK